MAYTSDNPLFRDLTDEEEVEFRQWARDHYVPFSEAEEIWHPVVRDECNIINQEETLDRQAHNDRMDRLDYFNA